jgi:hypothetical protein
LTFNGLRGFISQKLVLFWAVSSSQNFLLHVSVFPKYFNFEKFSNDLWYFLASYVKAFHTFISISLSISPSAISFLCDHNLFLVRKIYTYNAESFLGLM